MNGPTPGPWKVIPAAHGCAVESEEGAGVAWCGNNVSTRHGVAPFRANARLIAAAPDLLAAAEVAMNAARKRLQMERESIPIEEAGLIYDVGNARRDAIAKAKGAAPE